MDSKAQYDLIVIGSGPAGYVAAIRAAQLGMKTGCIEKSKTLGGTCLNIGCIPSKALLDSSEHYSFAKSKGAKHGLVFSDLRLDLGAMMKRKTEVVKQLTGGVAGLFRKNKIDFLNGTGKLLSAQNGLNRVEVKGDTGSQVYSAKNILIASGSIPIELPFLPFDGQSIVSSTEALEFDSVPNHLVVVGGGVIGLELGSVWARLGAKVTVIEFQPRIASVVDAQAGNELQKALIKQGLEFRLGTKCLGAKKSGGGLVVELEENATGTKSLLECDKILVATGRRAYTEGLGLDEAGVQKDQAGRVNIDDHFHTNVPGIYAVGDVVAGPMLAHKGEEEGIAAVEIMAGQAGHVNYLAIPNVIYTHPELASVGYTEEELKAKGAAYKSGSFPFLANGRAIAMGDTEGLVKILSDAKSDRVLGVHIVGARASEMIAELVAVMEFGGSAEDVARTCHAHPTLSEAVKEAALDVDKRKINL